MNRGFVGARVPTVEQHDVRDLAHRLRLWPPGSAAPVAQPLFSVVKIRRRVGGLEWLVFNGKERVKRAQSLADALTYFDKKMELVQ